MTVGKIVGLELRKNKAQSYIKLYIAITIFVIFSVWTTIFGVNQDHESSFRDIIKMMTCLITDIYFLLAAIVSIKVIVDEYTQRTIMLMYSYGIPRSKIMLSKIIVIGIISTVGLVLDFICSLVFLVQIDKTTDIVNGSFEVANLFQWINYLCVDILALVGFIFLPVIIGIIKKAASNVFVVSLAGLFLYQMLVSQIDAFQILYISFTVILIAYILIYRLLGIKYVNNLEL